ncbi:MAG: acyltransferase [Oscillospiraceae bacterium]|nr:acyltransferase [Oscillospiraceae bacterium]
MVVVSLLFIFLVLSSAKIGRPVLARPCNADGFSKDRTEALRGLLAVCVLLSHMTSCVDYQLPLVRFSIFAPVGVACFFFLSGFSLAKSATGKVGYFRSFLRKRLSKILLPYLVFLALYFLISVLILGDQVSKIYSSFRNGDPVSHSWYVTAIIFFYLAFYAVFRSVDPHNRKAVLIRIGFYSAVTFLYIMVTAVVLDLPDFWYKTCPMMIIGLGFGFFEDAVFSFLKKRYFLLLLLMLLCSGVAYFIPSIWSLFLSAYSINIWLLNDILMGFFISLLLLLLLFKINFLNKVTGFLGKISFEIYLFHGLVMEVLLKFGLSSGRFRQECFGVLSVLFTVILSYGFSKLSSVLNRFMIKTR